MADALNQVYRWPDGREVSRQLVDAWYRRGTLNRDGQPPPEPVTVHDDAPRTTPAVEFAVADWLDWVSSGVRGDRGLGWVVPVPRDGSFIPRPRTPADYSWHGVRVGDKITWIPLNSDRPVSGTVSLVSGGQIYAVTTASKRYRYPDWHRVIPRNIVRHRRPRQDRAES